MPHVPPDYLEEADVRLHLLLPLAVGVCCELLLLAFVAGSMLVLLVICLQFP